MIRNQCHACAKPLVDHGGTVVQDRDGLSYHLQCWCKVMDARRASAAAPGRRQPRERQSGPSRARRVRF